MALLREVGAERGFDVVRRAPFGEPNDGVRRRCARALESGDLDAARAVLGRPFTLRGERRSRRRTRRGARIPDGEPGVGANKQLPKEGVYAGVARRRTGTWRPAAISVGTRPQFYDDGDVLVEVHLLGYDGESLRAHARRRVPGLAARKLNFASEDELVARIMVTSMKPVESSRPCGAPTRHC